MNRSLAKQLDSSLEMLYNLRIRGIVPTDAEIDQYHNIFTILHDDGYVEPGTNGDEITAKGLAFMKKGGYVGQWNSEFFKKIWPLLVVIVGAILTCLLSLYTNTNK